MGAAPPPLTTPWWQRSPASPSRKSTLPGTTAGRCRLHGDVTTPGDEVTVEVHLAIVFGHPLEERASSLRRQLARELAVQTELNITSIDITITDVLEPQPAGPGTAAGLMGQTPPQEKP
ncbi:hypothetical protein ACFVGV_18380 [Pseudarthrobacter scleromae]|uniref:hypothetical protein n=1 Tax=Pseudarthrobacter scleromae TaxID=158897 RepID=UPI00364189E3